MPEGSPRRLRYVPVVILGTALAIRLVLFTGLQGIDDVVYSEFAHRLRQGDLSLPLDALRLRFGYTVPIAGLYAVFGVRVGCLILPNLAASMGLIWLAYRFGRELYTESVGRVAAAFVAVLPMDVFYATEGHTDLPMTAWAVLALYLLGRAVRSPHSKAAMKLAVSSGLAFGLAHLTKEAAFLLLLPALAWLPRREARRPLAVAAGTVVLVLAAESILYGIATGDPLFRAHAARAAQSGGFAYSPEELTKRIVLGFPSLVADPRNPIFPYTGGLFLWSAAGVGWALWRDRARSAWMVFWFLGVAILLHAWPLSIVPYRPAMLLHPRVYAPLAVPGAILAAAFLVDGLAALRPRIAWTAAALAAAVSLICAWRIHEDGTRQRRGIEWSHTQLASSRGADVITDHRSALMLRLLEGYAPRYDLREYTPEMPTPAPGTLLLDDDRWVAWNAEMDATPPPPWWRSAQPPREVLAETCIPGGWRFRGARGSPERVRISRVSR